MRQRINGENMNAKDICRKCGHERAYHDIHETEMCVYRICNVFIGDVRCSCDGGGMKMKKLISVFIVILILLLINGCNTTIQCKVVRIKQLEEEVKYWKKAHLELQEQFIKCKNKNLSPSSNSSSKKDCLTDAEKLKALQIPISKGKFVERKLDYADYNCEYH